VTNVQQAFRMIIRMAFRVPLMIVIELIVSFRIHAGISLVFLACIPVLGIGLFLIMQRDHLTFERVFRTFDRLNNVARENLRSFHAVKSFIREAINKQT